MAPTAEKEKTEDQVDQAEEWKQRALATFDPSESALARLERLEAETAEVRKAARKERAEKRAAEKELEESQVVQPIHDRITEILKEVEAETGKTFRAFVYRYTFSGKMEKEGEAPSVDGRHSLVSPRGAGE